MKPVDRFPIVPETHSASANPKGGERLPASNPPMFVAVGPGDAQGYSYCLHAAAEILESLPFRQGASRLAVNLRNLADLLDAENQRLREASHPDPAPSEDTASQDSDDRPGHGWGGPC